MKKNIFILLIIAMMVIAGCGNTSKADGGTSASSNKEITIAIFGGSWSDVIKKSIIEPYEKETGIKVKVIEGTSTVTFSRLLQEKGAPSIDLALLDSGISEMAYEGGVVDTIDKNNLKEQDNLLEEAYQELEGNTFAVALGYYGLGIAYNKNQIDNPPTSWTDLWKEEYEDIVTIPTPATTGGLPFLLKVAELEGEKDGEVDKAFDKIKEMKTVAYFDGAGVATNLFQSGEATVGAHYVERVYTMQDQGQPIEVVIPEDGVLGMAGYWHIVKGTEKEDEVYEFLNYATAKLAQEAVAEELYLAPIHSGVELSEKALERMPYGKGGTIKDIFMPDYNLINEHREEWNERWNKEIGN